MDLRLTETQEMFKKVAADFVRAEVPAHLMTQWYRTKETFRPEVYRKAASLGWLGMLLPEEYGGAETSFTDCATVFEELGRGPVPGPFFAAGVLAAQIVFAGGSDEQKKSLLPAICKGGSIPIPAITDKAAGWGAEAVETSLTRSGSGFILDGSKRFVFDAEAATGFIVAARTEIGEVALVLVDRASAGLSIKPLVGFTVSAAEVTFEKVRLSGSSVITASSGWQVLSAALEKSLPILCAYQVGACQEIFDFTAEYTRTRVVFGQPIGRFQRVQDHCVDLSVHLDAARYATYEALWRLDSGLPAAAAVHEAKAIASEGYYQACNYAHMVFAGPGTDYGHPLMAHSVLAHTLYQYLGTPWHHKRSMMDLLYPISPKHALR
ncbi:MAG: acyl-CoA/acyl-ACP dehydrogenase [Deltaproteobacteria bacterium]|nr:acyl-CoA/acyl-ACP dehydrogenase [Deltaproteobacteria bacterium]